MNAQHDPTLARLAAEVSGLVPRLGLRCEQYLLDWTVAAEDRTGATRRRLRELRRTLRKELGIDVAASSPGWDRRIVLEHFWFLYEKGWYDESAQAFLARKYARAALDDFGRIDAVCLWQSYPRLGLDHRNQFDYYRDLPGGIAGLRRVVAEIQEMEARCFLAYNPWDTGTRREPASDGETLGDFLKSTGADGVFLDTLDACDASLLQAIRAVRPDAAVCPELLPRLADLRLLSGAWQQFAPLHPRFLLAHRWLDPSFCLRFIDRYARTHREQVATAFLHGTGHVVWENVFGWWNPWSEGDRLFLKRTAALLNAYLDFFSDPEWEPFVPTGAPGVYAMEWHRGAATLFTLYNTNQGARAEATLTLPEGTSGLITDVWRSQEIARRADGRTVLCAVEPGSVTCVLAGLDPRPVEWLQGQGDSRRHSPVTLEAYKPRPPQRASARGRDRGRDMKRVPGGRYVMKVRRAANEVMEGGSYGDISHPTAKGVPDQYFWLEPFFLDSTPVTKGEYARFLRAARYRPRSLARFLDDWIRPGGSDDRPHLWKPPAGMEDHPVVWVSLGDARAYALWAGVRLPTEAEWQLAAEGPEQRAWPWGDEFDASRCNGDRPATTSVRAYPLGASAFGCLDMSGNVWEWTESERDDGHMRYAMVRGGCHLRAEGSIWYTAGGAQPCAVHEKVPLLDAGIDRLATVGFRCAL